MKQTDEGSRRRFLKVGSMLGLAAAFTPGSIVGAFANSNSKKEEETITQTSATQRGGEQAADKTAIRPFNFRK
jgi:uncharacterized protein (DUF1501 family)